MYINNGETQMLKILALTLTLIPGLALADNTTKTLSGENWWSVKNRIDSEIGFSGAIATVWNCQYTRCELNIAEWYYPERDLYVRLEGGAMATRLTVGPRCEAVRCDLVASLTGGERPRGKF